MAKCLSRWHRLQEKHAMGRGFRVPNDRLPYDGGKRRKTVIDLAGRRAFRFALTSLWGKTSACLNYV
jgi:hypothetical protein